MMDLLHNFSELCYLKVNIIPIVLTNRVIAKCARARASRVRAQMASLRHGESKCESVRRPRTRIYLLCLIINPKTMIREYELIKRKGTTPRLVVRVQRFPHDVVAWIKYYFADGHYEFKFPSSYVAVQVADEIRRFFELVNNPHWLAEIRPSCRYLDDTHNYDNDIIPF